MARILLLGDVHGDYPFLDWAVSQALQNKCNKIFCLGDWGYWEHTENGRRFVNEVEKLLAAHGGSIHLYFLDGNHDNHPLLWDAYQAADNEGFAPIRPHILYSPRGHRWEWDGVKFLSMGGAYSIDKDWRVRQYQENRDIMVDMDWSEDRINEEMRKYEAWWETEMITHDQVKYAQGGPPVDVLLSHDVGTDVDIPLEFALAGQQFFKAEPNTMRNRYMLQGVIDSVDPKFCYSGHYHLKFHQFIHGRRYQVLDCNLKRRDSWMVLDLDDVKVELNQSKV